MSTDYYPTKKIRINDFLRKENELKTLGVTIHKRYDVYLIQQDIPENVSDFEIWRSTTCDSWIERTLNDRQYRNKRRYTEEEHFELCKREYPEDVVELNQQRERSQYVWLYPDEKKEFISCITTYHAKFSDYLIHTLKQVTGSELIDEYRYHDNLISDGSLTG